MGKYSRLGKNTVIVFIGNAGSKLIGLLMLPFYTRWLSVEDYGTTDIINVYSSLLLGILSCCIAESIFIFPKGQPVTKQKEYFSSGLLFVLFVLLISFVLFSVIFCVFDKSNVHNSFTDNLWLIYGMIGATLLQQFFQQFTRSIDKMYVYGMAGMVLTVLTAVFSFVLIPKDGVKGFVSAIVIANICTSMFSLFCSNGYKYISLKSLNGLCCKEMLKYSIPLIPNAAMWWFVSSFNRPLMETHLGMEAIGFFAVANKFPGIVSMIFMIFVNSWQISVLEEYGKPGYDVFFNRVFRTVFWVLLVLLSIVTACSEWIVGIFASSDFIRAWQYVPLLTLGIVFSNVAGFVGSNFSAVKQSKYFFFSSVWGAIVAVVFNFLLIPFLGLWGAALSVALSFLAMALSRIVYAWKYVQITDIVRLALMSTLLLFYVGIVSFMGKTYWELGVLSIIALLLLNKDLLCLIKTKLKKKISYGCYKKTN